MTVIKAFLFFYIFIFTSLLFPQRVRANDSIDFSTIKVQTLEQTPVVLKEKFTGELLLLDFWASWCGPCKQSLPFYEQLQKRYGTQGLQVIAVSVDEDIKDASSFVAKNKYSLMFLWDPQKAFARSINVKAIPSTFLIDKTGKIIHRERGFQESSKISMDQEIAKYLTKIK